MNAILYTHTNQKCKTAMTLKMNVIYCEWHYYMCHVMRVLLLQVAMTEKKKRRRNYVYGCMKQDRLCLRKTKQTQVNDFVQNP